MFSNIAINRMMLLLPNLIAYFVFSSLSSFLLSTSDSVLFNLMGVVVGVAYGLSSL